ncbi:OmpA family protein [Algoriphagus sediminis]|uniref:OmpA family protein n=1 Tax=Algoriphagus sediminis TaxID=3057113 RepID=A0ABT7YE68_9BACT|nr:OmpA family protein [Algoriphagus sediminis]MDN3204793.1 OmpA family protein [Algoriphagus sediminis]
MKRLVAIIFLSVICTTASAQLYGNKWRFGVSTGVTNYFGDIRPLKVNNFGNFTRLYKRYDTYSEQLSYQISMEYALGKSVGLMLTVGTYQFGAGDRFVQNDGNLFVEGLNFERALNFQTDIYDTGLSFVFKPDNDWLLGGKSIIAPYFTLGFGVQNFDVNGDLLDENGNRYDYTNMNTIPDGTFETNLRDLRTEDHDGYRQTTLYANLGLGFRIRLSRSLEIFAQTDFKRAGTDYLDDISGQYRTSYDNDFQAYAAKPGTNVVTPENPWRGFENQRVDWYIYHGIGIKFSFGANKETFNPPVVTQRYTYEPSESDLLKLENQRLQLEPKEPDQTNYITVIQLPEKRALLDSARQISRTELDSAQMVELEVLRDSVQLDSASLARSLIELNNESEDFDEIRRLAESDGTTSVEVRNTRLQSIANQQASLQTRIDSLESLQSGNQFTLDSINQTLSFQSAMASQDTTSMAEEFNEILIYPGQVTRVLYSQEQATQVNLDSAQAVSNYESRTDMMSREQFDEELEKFREDMLQAQATRDSAMMMAFAAKLESQPLAESTAETEPQEIVLTQEGIDEETRKKIEKNNEKARKAEEKAARRQEKLDEKNNELLKDALLVGGTAAATAAITSGGNDKAPADSTLYQPDSLLLARIEQDSLLIDSLRNVPRVVDTVLIEKTNPLLLKSSKVEIYFGINETTLSEEEKQKLEPIATYLAENPDSKLELIGFADNTGTFEYNLMISNQRVEAVYRFLNQEFGIETDRMVKEVGGLIMRGSKQSMGQDRRVEIRLYQE